MSKKSKAEERAARLAAAQAEARRREALRRNLSIAGVVALVVVIIGGAFLFNKLRDDVNASGIGASDHGLVFGDAEAPHSLIIYEDFLCPICGVFEEAGREKLAAQVEAGNLVIEYRPIAILTRFGPYSEDAANAYFVVQDAAGDDVAKEFHDLLFENQPAEDSETWPDTDFFVDLAVEAGATEADVRPGIEDGAKMDDVEAATQEAEDAGVDGTPTLVLDGEKFQDGSSWPDIVDNIVSEVNE